MLRRSTASFAAALAACCAAAGQPRAIIESDVASCWFAEPLRGKSRHNGPAPGNRSGGLGGDTREDTVGGKQSKIINLLK